MGVGETGTAGGMFALFRRAHQSLQSLFARAHQAVRTRLVVTSSMVCGTFLKNGKPDNSKSCQVFDYEKDPESLQDVQFVSLHHAGIWLSRVGVRADDTAMMVATKRHFSG